MKRVIYYLSIVWVALAFSYAIYEWSAEKGLYARLLAWQLETFGQAELKLTVIGAGLIYSLPGIIALSLTRDARRLPDPVAGQRNAAIVLAAFGVVLILAGIAGYFINQNFVATQANGELPRPPARLVSVDLDRTNAVTQGSADGVSVTGWLRRDLQYQLEETGGPQKSTVFCPLVGEKWNRSEPIRVVMRADPTSPIALRQVNGPGQRMDLRKAFVPIDFASSEPLKITIEGTTRPGGLPAYVGSFFGKEGLKLASDYVVLEAKPFFDGGNKTEWEKFAATSYFLTYITVPIGLVMLLLSLVPLRRWRRMSTQL